MDKGRLFVQKKSVCRVVAIACSAVNLAIGAFSLLAVVLATIVGLIGTSDMRELKIAVVVTLFVSLTMTAQVAYSFYGVMVSHRTLKHIGWAWVAYPVMSVLGKLSISYMNYAEALSASDMIKQDVDVLSIVTNTLLLLISLAIGIVLLMCEQGKLTDKRILIFLSTAAYVISVMFSSIQFISYYTQTDGYQIMMVIAAVTSILITLGSGFITYGTPFFLALSMKNTSE